MSEHQNPAGEAPLDRERLRQRVRAWTEVQRLILVERVIEDLPPQALRQLLHRLVSPDLLVGAGEAARPGLLERVEAHGEETRAGRYLGSYVVRNRPGEREPEETACWVAATAHLFELALERSAGALD